MTQGSLLDDTPAPASPTINDQVVAADLWVLGIEDWLERFSSGRHKRPDHELANERKKLAAARAIVTTLKGVARGEGRVGA